ncbi:unnamed protein product [Rotaria socialis]|uniref:Reverse transcriptase domain-containing protein n=1 Tax=Rotaria socialis TaxID=392032 RepID=A0A821TI75_9BILA|nr:unnamed protein product [Rotaria socialis]CAF4870886.1 unnamed protein product [Rotaria socialis]
MTFDDITIATYQNLFGNEANKIIQELQPRKLNDQLKKYELKLKHYEDLYQNEINMFESKLIQTSLNHQHTQVGISMTLLKYYLSHHTNQLIRQIRYREACVHVKLVRQHHRHLLSKQQIVDVYPHIIADVPTIALNRLQLDYLSKSKAYTKNGYLKPKTYLCTFDITDLYTMLPQEESLDILIEFLLQHDYQKVQNIPIDIIRKLALIVIKENVFVYERKFYRQVIGGAMSSAFTLTLANT